jgi:RHS repeat-associated protein
VDAECVGVVCGGATLFLGDTSVSQAVGSSVQEGFRTYSGAEGKPVAQRSAKSGTAGSVVTWLFTNLEGTVDAQTDAVSGVTVQQYREGYMNKQVAEATALTNVGARTYDPSIGKFLSVDPVIDTNLPQQNTGYAYSGNNPTTYTDPTGLKFQIDCPSCKGAC